MQREPTDWRNNSPLSKLHKPSHTESGINQSSPHSPRETAARTGTSTGSRAAGERPGRASAHQFHQQFAAAVGQPAVGAQTGEEDADGPQAWRATRPQGPWPQAAAAGAGGSSGRVSADGVRALSGKP